MPSEEHTSKKAKTDNGHSAETTTTTTTGWENHTMNISEATMKADEGRHLGDIKDDDVSTLQGIGPNATAVLEHLGVKTIPQLAKYKYFLLARSLTTLSQTETKGRRLQGSVMNVDKAVDKTWETKSLIEMCDAPTEALQGISKGACELLEKLGVKTIKDLAEFKYCRWAEAIVHVAQFEHTKTEDERREERTGRREERERNKLS